jgi:hypothetical protein
MLKNAKSVLWGRKSGLKGFFDRNLRRAKNWTAALIGLYLFGAFPIIHTGLRSLHNCFASWNLVPSPYVCNQTATHMFAKLSDSIDAMLISDVFGYDMTISWFNPPENDAKLKAIYVEYKFSNNKNDIGPPYKGTGIEQGPSPIKVYADRPNSKRNRAYTLNDKRNPTFTLKGVPESAQQGKYLILALRAVDTAGNSSAYSSTIWDPAEISGNNDPPIATTKGTELSFPAHRAGRLSGEDSWDIDGSVSDFNWRITDENGWEKWISGKNAFWEPPQEGQYLVQLFVTDDRGKGSRAGAIVRVEPGDRESPGDWEGPTAYIEDFASFTDQLSVAGTVCDDAGIGGLELKVNGTDIPFSMTNAGTLCWDFASSAVESGGDGEYVWEVAVWDNNSNYTSRTYTQTIITAPSLFETDTEVALGSDNFTIRSDFTGAGITDAYYSFDGLDEIITLTPRYVTPNSGYLTINDPELLYRLVKQYGELRFLRTLVNGVGTEVTQTGTFRFESEEAPGKRLVPINGQPMFSMDDPLDWNNQYPGVIEIDQDHDYIVEGTASLAVTYSCNAPYSRRFIWTSVPPDKQDITGKKKALVSIKSDNDVVLGLMGSNGSVDTPISWFDVKSGESVYEVALENWGDFIDRFYLRILGEEPFKAGVDNIVFVDDVVQGPVLSGQRLCVKTDSLNRWDVDSFPEIISIGLDRNRKTEGNASVLVDYAYNPAFLEGYVSYLIPSADRDCSGMGFLSFFAELETGESVHVSISGENNGVYTPIEWLTIVPGANYYTVDISEWDRDDLRTLHIGLLGAEGMDYRLRLDDIELSEAAQSGGNFEWMRLENFNEADWVPWNSEVCSLSLDSERAHGGTSLKVDFTYDGSAGSQVGIGKEISGRDLSGFDTLRIWSKADFVYGAETREYGILAGNEEKYSDEEWFEAGQEPGFSNVSLLGIARDAWDYFYIKFNNVEGKDHTVHFDSITLVDTKGEPSVVWSKDKNEAIVIRYDGMFRANGSARYD